MTKRLLCLLMALIMLLSLCMTACSSEEETAEEGEAAEAEVQRRNLYLTIYAIKGKNTTDEALKIVEKQISNYCIAKYKTAIELRFFDENEYQAALNDMYDKFAAKEAEKAMDDKSFS